jgi:hypothetical protein
MEITVWTGGMAAALVSTTLVTRAFELEASARQCVRELLPLSTARSV